MISVYLLLDCNTAQFGWLPNIHANEGVPSDIKFTSAATNDSFMLKPTIYNEGDIVALDRA